MDKLEEAANAFASSETLSEYENSLCVSSFIAGAEWKRNNLWIPVSEYLPPCVIGGYCSMDVFVLNHAASAGYYDKSRNKWFSNWDEGVEIEGITHWMPIPEMKKGE